MAPVGPLHFVARQASAWIMTFYTLATSFVTSVEWTDVTVTQLSLLNFVYHIKVTNDVAQRRITIIQVFAHSCCVCAEA